MTGPCTVEAGAVIRALRSALCGLCIIDVLYLIAQK